MGLNYYDSSGGAPASVNAFIGTYNQTRQSESRIKLDQARLRLAERTFDAAQQQRKLAEESTRQLMRLRDLEHRSRMSAAERAQTEEQAVRDELGQLALAKALALKEQSLQPAPSGYGPPSIPPEIQAMVADYERLASVLPGMPSEEGRALLQERQALHGQTIQRKAVEEVSARLKVAADKGIVPPEWAQAAAEGMVGGVIPVQDVVETLAEAEKQASERIGMEAAQIRTLEDLHVKVAELPAALQGPSLALLSKYENWTDPATPWEPWRASSEVYDEIARAYRMIGGNARSGGGSGSSKIQQLLLSMAGPEQGPPPAPTDPAAGGVQGPPPPPEKRLTPKDIGIETERAEPTGSLDFETAVGNDSARGQALFEEIAAAMAKGGPNAMVEILNRENIDPDKLPRAFTDSLLARAKELMQGQPRAGATGNGRTFYDGPGIRGF